MKHSRTNAGAGWIAPFFVFAFVCLPAIAPTGSAAQFQKARVTRIIKNVELLPSQAKPRAAAVNDEVSANTAVRTGTDSRTELTFGDLTITRLGANTTFSFDEGTRQIDLGSGAVLVQVPRNATEMKISTAAVTAAVSGGTALFESNKNFPTKLLIMEGIGRFYRKGHPERAVIVHGGEMVMMTPDGQITRPTKFNAGIVYRTSKLFTSFPTLPNADLIFAVIDQQLAELSEEPSSPPWDDSLDETDQAIAAQPLSPTGSPKVGPPVAITSPNPYVITIGTLINTDPTITTNGITDFGKLYRGAGRDGPLATWLGDSPRPFDSVDFFDSNSGGFNNPETVPIPGFLFAGLQLEGDPMVSNSSGYRTLGLVSQGGINTSPSGAAFTFAGISEVALIALNGSIDLSGISFTNFEQLFVYARGSGSNLTLNAPISNLDKVRLRAEGSIQIQSPVMLNGTTQERGFKALAGNALSVSSTVNSNGIILQSLGGINITSSAQLLAMLNSMGNSGQIVMIAEGSDTAINVSGTVQADQGEVDIRHNGVAGMTTLNNAIINGDVVKISALGNNGTLNIGTGNTLSAGTVIKLYAPGSNGTLNFLSNVTLTSPTNILAANRITISTGVLVTINSPSMAQIYTNNPDYFFVPQPGYNGPPPNPANGSFAGAGAKDPQPLANRPPLGDPGTGP